MLANLKGSVTADLLNPADHADTAAATGTAVDISEYEGPIIFTEHCGVVTAGTLDGDIQTGDESDGSDAANVTGGAFTQRTTSTDVTVESLVIEASSLSKYVRYKGTIVTGAALVGCTMIGKKKYVP